MKTGEYERSVFVESVETAMQGIKVEKGSGPYPARWRRSR